MLIPDKNIVMAFVTNEGQVGKAEKAFFAARIIDWIRHKAETETDFDLTSYLTILMYYKTGMADLKFSENGDKILYQMNNNDKEVQELVDSLIKSTSQSRQDSPSTGESDSASTESTDRDPEP